MTAAQPQTIANLLFGKLEALFQLSRPITVFDTNSINREADKLAKSDPSSACIVKAGIAALNWNFEEAQKQTHKALQLNPGAISPLLNSAINFRYLNDMRSASSYAKQALDLANNDKKVLDEASAYAFNAGQVRESYQMLYDRRDMGLALDGLEQQTKFFLDWMSELKVTEVQLQTEIGCALDVLTNYRIRFLKIDFERNIFPEDDVFCLSTRIHFLGDFETEMQLESELAKRQIDLPNWDLSKLAVEFSHISKDELQAA